MSVLVTGATRGIGRAVFEREAQRRLALGVYQQSHELARRCEAELASSGAKPARLLAADLADLDAIDGLVRVLGGELESLAALLEGEFQGPLGFSGVVLNAGVSEYGRFVRDKHHSAGLTERSTSAAQRAADPLLRPVAQNLTAPLYLLRALLEAGLLREGASIVVVSSNLARHAVLGRLGYAVAKAGLEAAVRQLCLELGPARIRVNGVAPGIIRTDMTNWLEPELEREYLAETPLGRVGSAEEVATVVSFFLSEAAQYVSGQVLDIDGGWGAR